MPIQLSEHDQRLIQDLYQEESDEPTMRSALLSLRRGGGTDAIISMLIPFHGLLPGFPRRRHIGVWFAVRNTLILSILSRTFEY
jgi:hypothetical protein